MKILTIQCVVLMCIFDINSGLVPHPNLKVSLPHILILTILVKI